MTPELQRLLDLYAALQNCAPQDQAGHREAFAAEVKRVADRVKVDHWRVSAHVQKQWEIICQREDKRKLGHSAGQGIDRPQPE